MTMHTYTLPDKTIAPTDIPASDWSERNWLDAFVMADGRISGRLYVQHRLR